MIIVFRKPSLTLNTEQGAIIPMFAVFMVVMIPLLALSVDMYFMTQGRLEEQNLAEYAALTSLDGYVKATEDNQLSPDHGQSKTNSLNFVKSIEGQNGVTGLTEGTDWNFTPTECTGNLCTGSGWSLQYGSWDGTTFTPAVAEVMEDPESIDPTLVNAVKFSMKIPDSGFVNFFRKSISGTHEGQGSSQNIKLPVTAIGYVSKDLSGKYFRLTRHRAMGEDDI